MIIIMIMIMMIEYERKERISYSDNNHVFASPCYNTHEDGHIPSTTQPNLLMSINPYLLINRQTLNIIGHIEMIKIRQNHHTTIV